MNNKKFERKLKKIQERGERYKKEKEVMDLYAEYLPSKKNKKISNIMLVVSVIAIVGYVIASFWLQLMTGVEISATVTTMWFAFWTVEIWQLARIKVNKLHTVEQPMYTDDGMEG